MRKLVIILIGLMLLSNLVGAVSVDIKTKFKEKSEITAIKVGATYWLEKQGVEVVNIGEDYAVWLKDLERKFVKENYYSYNLTVTLSFPTSLFEKRAIKEKVIYFEVDVAAPLGNSEDELDERLDSHFSRVKARLKREAYVGGLAVAATVLKFLSD